MTDLPPDIKDKFFKIISGDISIDDFEQWVYKSKELEDTLTPDDYLELISLNYKKNGAKYELYNVLKKHIDISEYETQKFRGLLLRAKKKDEKLPKLLMEFYDLYCRGYGFLDDLGVGYGLSVECPPTNNYAANTWDELSPKKQQELLDSFSPGLDETIDRVLGWIENKRIILTGEQDDIGNYDYIDNRTEEEKKSRLWVTVQDDKTTGETVSKNKLWDNKGGKKWWEIWK